MPSQAHAPRATRTAVRASPRRAAAGSTQRSGSGSGPNDPAPPGMPSRTVSVTAFPNPAAEEPSVDARAEPPAALSLIGAVMWETLQPNANCCHECCRNATRTLLWVCVMVLMVGGGPFLVLFCISFAWQFPAVPTSLMALCVIISLLRIYRARKAANRRRRRARAVSGVRLVVAQEVDATESPLAGSSGIDAPLASARLESGRAPGPQDVVEGFAVEHLPEDAAAHAGRVQVGQVHHAIQADATPGETHGVQVVQGVGVLVEDEV